MKKRAIISLIVLSLFFACVAYRMLSVTKSAYAQVAAYHAQKSIVITTVKGKIYDRNGIPLVDTQKEFYAAVKPTADSLHTIKSLCEEQTLSVVTQRIQKGLPTVCKVEKILNNTNNIVYTSVANRYAENPLAVHIIGYQNGSRHGVCGIEKSYQEYLETVSFEKKAIFAVDANGKTMNGEKVFIENAEKEQQAGIVLTIDSRMQRIVENAAKMEKGAIIITDVQSGEIAASVSRPNYNPSVPQDSLNAEGAPFLNRAFQPFTVGSSFKLVVAACGLENDINAQTEYTCTGMTQANGVTFHCHDRNGHGTLNMKQAIAFSCNTWFISFARELSVKKILELASDFGFGKATKLAPNMVSSAGNLPTSEEIKSRADLANLSFGQGSLTATPLQICAMTASIANGGTYYEPYIVVGTKDENGLLKIENQAVSHRVIKKENANELKQYMRYVVTEGTGTRANTAKMAVAGKTATAQTGQHGENGEIYNAWFTGFFPYDEPRYALTVLIEDGGEGAITAAPVFKEIAEQIMQNNLLQ